MAPLKEMFSTGDEHVPICPFLQSAKDYPGDDRPFLLDALPEPEATPSALLHSRVAALIEDAKVVAAVQEENARPVATVVENMVDLVVAKKGGADKREIRVTRDGANGSFGQQSIKVSYNKDLTLTVSGKASNTKTGCQMHESVVVAHDCTELDERVCEYAAGSARHIECVVPPTYVVGDKLRVTCTLVDDAGAQLAQYANAAVSHAGVDVMKKCGLEPGCIVRLECAVSEKRKGPQGEAVYNAPSFVGVVAYPPASDAEDEQDDEDEQAAHQGGDRDSGDEDEETAVDGAPATATETPPPPPPPPAAVRAPQTADLMGASTLTKERGGAKLTLHRVSAGVLKKGPRGKVSAAEADLSSMQDAWELPTLEIYGTHMLAEVHKAACNGSSAFKSRRATEDNPLPEDAARMDKAKYDELFAATARGRKTPLIADRESAYARSTAALQDIVRWFRGEHPFIAICTRCDRVCTISALHKTPGGAPNPNRGWWVVMEASLLEVAAMDQTQLHAAVAKAELHLVCEHGVGPRVGCRVRIDGTTTRQINGKVGVVTKVDHDKSPATFEVLVGNVTVSVELEHLHPAPL